MKYGMIYNILDFSSYKKTFSLKNGFTSVEVTLCNHPSYYTSLNNKIIKFYYKLTNYIPNSIHDKLPAGKVDIIAIK